MGLTIAYAITANHMQSPIIESIQKFMVDVKNVNNLLAVNVLRANIVNVSSMERTYCCSISIVIA